ncbi:MAG TPA: GrpB family protein [Pseudogracilibacillus sp.]|nr:GrpB family protein [Pseudogracilibacillus sp.]
MKFRDILLQNSKYRNEYDNLKRKLEGKKMDHYRKAKNDFFNKITQTKEYQEL